MTNWRVTEPVAITIHGDSGYGFNIVNEHGRPVMTFIYGENHHAKDAAAQVQAALGKARVVQAHSLT